MAANGYQVTTIAAIRHSINSMIRFSEMARWRWDFPNPPERPRGVWADPAPLTWTTFRNHIPKRVFDAYCEASAWKGTVEEGVRSFGLDRRIAELSLDMELERLGVANEPAPHREAEAMLRQFTDDDSKLDDKERSDIAQLV